MLKYLLVALLSVTSLFAIPWAQQEYRIAEEIARFKVVDYQKSNLLRYLRGETSFNVFSGTKVSGIGFKHNIFPNVAIQFLGYAENNGFDKNQMTETRIVVSLANYRIKKYHINSYAAIGIGTLSVGETTTQFTDVALGVESPFFFTGVPAGLILVLGSTEETSDEVDGELALAGLLLMAIGIFPNVYASWEIGYIKPFVTVESSYEGLVAKLLMNIYF